MVHCKFAFIYTDLSCFNVNSTICAIFPVHITNMLLDFVHQESAGQKQQSRRWDCSNIRMCCEKNI